MLYRRWDSNPHEVALTGFFESALLMNGPTPRDRERQYGAFIASSALPKCQDETSSCGQIAVNT